MIAALFRGPFHWFVDLIEIVSVVGTILLVGLVIGMTGFWILGRFVRKLGGPPAELDDEDELEEDVAGQGVSMGQDEESRLN